jgi:hypothetical protein
MNWHVSEVGNEMAIGFVAFCKTSGMPNFAQGLMTLIAAPTLLRLVERGAAWAQVRPG